jgi:MMP alpha-(1->4)-mannosyltransferase
MDTRPLRIALLTYRGHPFVGGQGIYVRHLSRELAELGHTVEVLSGQPYPEVDTRVSLTEVPSLDLYRSADPFRIPAWSEFEDWTHFLEYGVTATATFAEPLAFSLRAYRELRDRPGHFDVVHDNQCLGYGILGIHRRLTPVLATIHHPITIDRRLETAHAPTWWTRTTKRRFYAFVEMQGRVARRLPRIVTVSSSSRRDIVETHRVDDDRLHVVNVGVDTVAFRPRPEVRPVPGRVMTTASADVAMKGLRYLLEAVAKARTERDDVHLVVIGQPKEDSTTPGLIRSLGLTDHVRFVSGVTDDRIVELYAEAQLAVVPSLYEGFSLPAVEAMSCGTPLLASTGGALPEVVGPDGVTALHVRPGDAGQLALRLLEALGRDDLRATIGVAGRQRVEDNFSWRTTAHCTVEQYRALLAEDGRTPC